MCGSHLLRMTSMRQMGKDTIFIAFSDDDGRGAAWKKLGILSHLSMTFVRFSASRIRSDLSDMELAGRASSAVSLTLEKRRNIFVLTGKRRTLEGTAAWSAVSLLVVWAWVC